MANVTIFGGHGKIALLLAPLLVARGDAVTSVFRNPDHEAEVAATGATTTVADVEEQSVEQLTELLGGQDVVVWSAGAGGGNPARTRAVDRDAAMRAVDAAEQAGVRRFVMVSYLGARQDHGVPEDNPFYHYAQAKADADDHLRASRLEWTVLGPGSLTLEEPSGQITVFTGEADGSRDTSRANVAQVIVATLDEPATVRRTIGFADGRTPIAEALAPQQ